MEESTKPKTDRYWQNWDNGDAVKNIDKYWLDSEGPWRKMLVKHLKKKLVKGQPVLEIGSGTGLILHELLAQRVVNESDYSGGDISLQMLEVAKKRFPKTSFRQLDIFNLDLPSASIDNVINVHVVQHLPEYKKPLLELLRVAKRKLCIVSWFTKDPADKIVFSEPSDRWDGQRFFNNTYSLPLFLEFATSHLGQRIDRYDAHWFDATNCAITFELKP